MCVVSEVKDPCTKLWIPVMSRLMEDLPSFPSTASTSQEDHEGNSGTTSSRKLRVTLLSSEWRSTKGGLSTINRELAIQLAKHPKVEVSVYLPQCSEEDKRVAASHNVHLIEAEEMPGYDNPVDWLSFLPESHSVDCVIGHGAVLGRQVQGIKRQCKCQWIQVVHTAPEELGMYKSYSDAISKGEKKHQAEVKLCEKADQVVAVGPKLAEAFSGYLRACGKDQDVLNLTPGIFSEFSDVKQATEERKTFSVLVFGRGDNEDFQLKGYDIAARAIAELKDEPQPYKLLFVGAPSGEEEKVKDLLLQQGIDRSQLTVRCFNESREQLARLFCEVDLAIMPSRTEGFGLAALEALSAGLPVLVSGNSGLGEALKEVPYGSSCVVESEDPKDWASAIKAVRKKNRKLRLRESKVLRGEYAEMYSWLDHCNRLVERMLAISQGPSTEHNPANETAVICQVEKPSSSEKRLHKGILESKDKRPLSSCAVPAPKQPKLLKEEEYMPHSFHKNVSVDSIFFSAKCYHCLGEAYSVTEGILISHRNHILSLRLRFIDKYSLTFLFPAGWDNSVVVELLKAEYKRRSLLRPLLWDSTIELPLENVYTRLKIISRRKLPIQMEAMSENDKVKVTEIFKTLEKGNDVMALVEGSPGIGKTTFCLKLAYDSTHGKIPTGCSFPKFEVVLLLKCRDIDGNIMDTIREQLLPRDIEEKIVEKLLHFLKDIHNQERILIILDGLDELPEKSRYHVDELLHRRIFPFCYVLATTRQERGIEARKTFVFDIHLEIKGYTESDSTAYVRRHFETIGQSPKGERLIEEMQQNTFLNALRNNPLNLLLLCVVYEDYEGKLPTSRTELYQVIVQCLLRRYRAKRNLPVTEDDSVLEKMFEMEILALGELAWLCLLSDRYGFRETKMDKFERKYPGLVARELGLLYKEESLKRLKPQHEYCFLHKTFQEYVAAAYIAQKLRNQNFNVFKHLNISFDDIVTKYRQVFIFVSGMLREKATVLFTQIGEELKKSHDWNWNKHCTEERATFFIESFNESGHAEQMAVSLCNIIPFPKVITSNLICNYDNNASFIKVLNACRSFSNVQITVELYADIGPKRRAIDVVNYIESYPQPTIASFCVRDLGSLTSFDVDRLCKWFASKRLSVFTLKYISYVQSPKLYELLVQIGRGLASCRTLTKVTFALPGYAYNESVFNAVETGLTTLTSVNLVLWGSMKYTATRALQKFLSNKSLNSLSLRIVGCVLDLLVAAVSQALARQTVLKSLDLHLDGLLSSYSARVLEKGLMENSSLNYLRLRVHGELPGNWHSFVENLRLAKKSPVSCFFYPNTLNNVANNYFHPVLVRKGLNVKQHLTVNVWGEMKCEAAEALCEFLAPSSITVLTLNVHGNLTSEVSSSIARCLEENKTLSSLSINLWGEVTTEGGIVPSSLSKNSRVQLNVYDVRIGPGESNDILVITTDNSAALRVYFTKVKDRRKEKVSLTINNDSNVTKVWTRCLGDALAENPSLTTLDLTVNSCFVDADLGENLGESLLRSPSLTSLSLTFNYSNIREGWECKLRDRLIKMASLTTLSLKLNGDGLWNQEDCLSPALSLDDGEENQDNCLSATKLSNVLAAIKSLSTLSVAIHRDGMCSFWDKVVGDCLIKCTSLKKLSLTLNWIKSDFHCGFRGLCNGLVTTSSLNTLCIAMFINGPTNSYFEIMLDSLNQGLSLNSSVTTLTLTVTLAGDEKDDIIWLTSFDHGLSGNTSITTLNVTINECGDGKSRISEVLCKSRLFEGLASNTSVTTFNLALNSSREVRDVWLAVLSNTLKKNTALTTLRLKVNNLCATGKGRLYAFRNLLIESRSLSLIELDLS
ncbi:unnamed protein product, partial [Porites lobata]